MPVYHGKPPFLECSSAGDARFSAFYAPIRRRGNETIEHIYQRSKVFSCGATNLSIKEAKGKKAVNWRELRKLYATLWDEYMLENLDLLPVLRAASGLSDRFGRPGGVCQATELWRIRNTWPVTITEGLK